MSALLHRWGHVKLDNGSDEEDEGNNDNSSAGGSRGGISNKFTANNSADPTDSPSKQEDSNNSSFTSFSQSSVPPVSPGSTNTSHHPPTSGRLIKALKGLKDLSIVPGTASPSRIMLVKRGKSSKSLTTGGGSRRNVGQNKDTTKKEAILSQFEHMASKAPVAAHQSQTTSPSSPPKRSASEGATTKLRSLQGVDIEDREIIRITTKKKKKPTSTSTTTKSVSSSSSHSKREKIQQGHQEQQEQQDEQQKDKHATGSSTGTTNRRKVGMSSTSLSTRSMLKTVKKASPSQELHQRSKSSRSLVSNKPITGSINNNNDNGSGGATVAASVISNCNSQSPLLGGKHKSSVKSKNLSSNFDKPPPLSSQRSLPIQSNTNRSKPNAEDSNSNPSRASNQTSTVPAPILRKKDQSRWSTKLNNNNTNMFTENDDEDDNDDNKNGIGFDPFNPAAASTWDPIDKTSSNNDDENAWNIQSFDDSFGTTTKSTSPKSPTSLKHKSMKRNSSKKQSPSKLGSSSLNSHSIDTSDDGNDSCQTPPQQPTIDSAAVAMLQSLTPKQQELFLSYAATAIVQTMLSNNHDSTSNTNIETSPTPTTSSYKVKKRIVRKKVTTTSEVYCEEEGEMVKEMQSQRPIGNESDRDAKLVVATTGKKNKISFGASKTTTTSTKKEMHYTRSGSSKKMQQNQVEQQGEQHHNKTHNIQHQEQLYNRGSSKSQNKLRSGGKKHNEFEDEVDFNDDDDDYFDQSVDRSKGSHFQNNEYSNGFENEENHREAEDEGDGINDDTFDCATFVEDGRTYHDDHNDHDDEEDEEDEDEDADEYEDEDEDDNEHGEIDNEEQFEGRYHDDNKGPLDEQSDLQHELEEDEEGFMDDHEGAYSNNAHERNADNYYSDYDEEEEEEEEDIWNVTSQAPSNNLRPTGNAKPSRLYEYAQQCEWDMVLKECKTNGTEARYVSEIDGGYTALHLAVISRSNPRSLYSEDNQTNLDDIMPAPLHVIEELIKACPEAAIIRCARKRYTPLTYACTAPTANFKYDMNDTAAMVRIILEHAPHSAMVFTDEELSPLDVHIVSYSHRVHEERRHKKNGQHSRRASTKQSSTVVINELLESTQALAEARSHKGSIQGPVELLYRCNMKEFKQRSSGDHTKVRKGGSQSSTSSSKFSESLEEWWAWEWTLLLLKYSLRSGSSDHDETDEIPFMALHAAAKLTACPIPVLTLALTAYPKQIEERSPKDDLYNFPLHDVCSWVSNNEIISGDPFILRRKEMAIGLLLDAYPKVARMTNNMGETPLQLAVETCTPWDQGLKLLMNNCPNTLKFPRRVLENRNENGPLAKAIKLMHDGENESLYSDDEDYWTDPMEAIEGMYPFMIAAVLSYIPECRLRSPPTTIIYNQMSTDGGDTISGKGNDLTTDDANNTNNNTTTVEQQHKRALELKDLQSLQTIYGLLRAKPSVLQAFIDDERKNEYERQNTDD